jgi:hypothetical protein
MSSYSRACRNCGRRINIRLMPHGQWVSFEGDQQHVCDDPPPKRTAPPVVKSRTPTPAEPPAAPFKPLYPEVEEDPAPNPQPAPARPVSTPAPAPRPMPAPQPPCAGTPTPIRVTPQPLPSPERSPSGNTASPTQPSPRPISPQPAPTRRPSIIKMFFGMITGLLGSTFGLIITAFGLLSLPLNVVAAMHIFGWSWFGALVGVILFACIPYIGQLGFLILAAMGAYYVWDANFDWQKAAYPSIKTFSVVTLSDADLERFKTEVVRPGFENACKAEALKTAGFDGKLSARAASKCECFATNFVARLARADMIAFEKSGQYPDDMQQRVGTEIRSACPN